MKSAEPIPAQSQLIVHLRQLIAQKRLPVDTKLPSIRALAELWRTNYHTVHIVLSTLAGEGLVVLRPVRGTFIAAPRRALRHACFYYHHDSGKVALKEEFYSTLNQTLYSLLAQRRVRIVPFFDSRPFGELHTVPPELRRMVSEREVDAVIATEIYPSNTGWLLNLEVPTASLMFQRPERTIEPDFIDLARKVIDLARKENRKTIGFIHRRITDMPEIHGKDLLLDRLKAFGSPHGISIVSQRLPLALQRKVNWEQEGALLCEHLFRSGHKPDMIFVYPDSMMRGVAMVLKDHRIRVPEDILVASHRNAECEMYIPFPMTWLTVRILDFATKLIEQIDRQIVGDDLVTSLLPIEIEHTAPLDVDWS